MTRERALASVVLAHLAIGVVHGGAHSSGRVALPLAGTLFVFIVILAGPLVGLIVSRWRPRLGGWIVAASMAGALAFGLVNHFIIDGSDHVARVASAWRSLFGVTAALLAVSEAAGVAAGIWSAGKGRSLVSEKKLRHRADTDCQEATS